jgi:heat-inducible transcriptional repressor
MQLKEATNAPLSAATIRNYFRRLVEEGFLTQLHSSGGRIPTDLALKSYWLSAIDPNDARAIDEEAIENAARAYGLYALLAMREPNRLLEVTKSRLGRILAAFEFGETALGANAAIERLLNEFCGYDITDLIEIAKSNRIDALYNALLEIELSRVKRYNADALIDYARALSFDFDRLYSGAIAAQMSAQLLFDSPAMIVAQKVTKRQKPALLVAFGVMNRDFLGFINHIKKED